MRISIVCVFAMLFSFSCCELYSAVEELADLIDNDEKIIEAVRELTHKLEGLTSKIKIELDKMVEEHETMKRNPIEYVKNPLNAFLLIKRLSNDVSMITENLSRISTQFSSKTQKFVLPREDLTGVVDGIYRLQKNYDLKSENLAQGKIYNKKYRKEFSVDDLLVIGKEMAHFDDHSFSTEYLNLAKKRNSILKNYTEMEILEKIFDIYNSSSMLNEAVEIIDKILEIEPTKEYYEVQRLNIELKSLFDENIDEIDESKDLLGSHFTPIKEKLIVKKACMKELMKSVEETSHLHCRYLKTNHFTIIAPFKIIEANLNPFVAIFLDVISDSEIEKVKSLSKNQFRRAEIMVNETTKVSNIRVSKVNWHYDYDDKIFKILSDRVGDMSGLNMKTAEMWQIQNYGIGGHYNAHYDFTVKGQHFQLGTGNRIATTLFYLTDVELGGATVFPFLRIYVPPKKGTAVYWYNLSTSGHREYMTRHAACPVIVGNKWVANKWLHEYGQEFVRPCELQEAWTDDFYYTRVYSLEDYDIYV